MIDFFSEQCSGRNFDLEIFCREGQRVSRDKSFSVGESSIARAERDLAQREKRKSEEFAEESISEAGSRGVRPRGRDRRF